MDKAEKLKEIQGLLNSGFITESEYNKLKNELNYSVENADSVIELDNLSPFNKKIITQIKNAGNSLKGVYICIILQIINGFVYGFLIGFKSSFLKESNIESTVGFIYNCQIIFGIIALIIFLRMLFYINQAASSLINIGKNNDDEGSFDAITIVSISMAALIVGFVWYITTRN